jgi:outer membrane protein TolC
MLERGMMPDASAGMPMASFGGQRKAPDRPDYARGEAYMAEMRRASQAERDALALAEAQARAATREWLADLDMARRQERLMEKTILPLARSAYEAARSAYEAGGVGFMDLLAVERDLAQARLDLAAARRDLNLAVLKQAEPTGRLP